MNDRDLTNAMRLSPLFAPAQRLGIANPAWEAATARFLIVRLSPFKDVDRSTTHLFLYSLARTALGDNAYLDFAFLPARPDRRRLSEAHRPWLFGLSRQAPEKYDALLVSCSYALELANLPLLLRHSGFPVRSSARRSASPSGRPWPLVVLGGSNALASQAVIFKDGDSFADGVFFGEAEDGGEILIRCIAETRGQNSSARLRALEAAVPAFWAAGIRSPLVDENAGGRMIRAGRWRASTAPFQPENQPFLNSPEAGTARLRIAWGCPSFCAFCFEGWERKPYRELDADRVLVAARALAQSSGAATLELSAFNFNCHQDIFFLIYELNTLFNQVNMMSQRADILQRTPGMVVYELAAEKRGYTIGVEGLSAGLRAGYAKELSENDLRLISKRLIKERAKEIKYFYILSGGEQPEDFIEFDAFCGFLAAVKAEERSGTRLLFSAGYLVKMPFTPLRSDHLEFNRAKMAELAIRMEGSVKKNGFEFRLSSSWTEYVANQLLVSGGYALADGLERAAADDCVYDGGIEGPLTEHLATALASDGELDAATTPADFTGPLIATKATNHRYPLDFVRIDTSPAFITARGTAAAERRQEASCLGGSCAACGACRENDERRFLTGHRIRPLSADRSAEALTALIRAKRRAVPVYLAINLSDDYKGACPEYLEALLQRRIFQAAPDLIGKLFRVKEALWTGPFWRDRFPSGAVGRTVVALYGIGGSTPTGEPRLAETEVDRCLTILSTADSRHDADDAGNRELPDFSPESVETAELTIDAPWAQADGLRRTRAWLASLKLAVIERNGTADSRVFETAPKDRRKRIVETVALTSTERSLIKIRAGAKLDLSGLLKTAEDRAGTTIKLVTLVFKPT